MGEQRYMTRGVTMSSIKLHLPCQWQQCTYTTETYIGVIGETAWLNMMVLNLKLHSLGLQ